MSRYKLVVLGLLKDKPRHGYQIDQEIRKRHMDIWANINVASIYNTLISMEAKRFISEKKEKVGKMPQRKVYSITSSGKKELEGLVMDGLSKVIKNDIVYLLSAGFMSNIPVKKALRALVKRKERLESIACHVKEVYEKHKGVISFNWLHIIETALEMIKIKIKMTINLIKKTEVIKKWE